MVRPADIPIGPIADQPPPVQNDYPGVWVLVIEDMENRDQVGRERYGTPLLSVPIRGQPAP